MAKLWHVQVWMEHAHAEKARVEVIWDKDGPDQFNYADIIRVNGQDTRVFKAQATAAKNAYIDRLRAQEEFADSMIRRMNDQFMRGAGRKGSPKAATKKKEGK